VRAGIVDVRDGTFSLATREELWQLHLRLPTEPMRPRWDVPAGFDFMVPDVLYARLAWMLPFLDRKADPGRPRLKVVPDPAPPGDLAGWRALTYIPLALKTMAPPRFAMEGLE
jgi:hypothetical protein